MEGCTHEHPDRKSDEVTAAERHEANESESEGHGLPGVSHCDNDDEVGDSRGEDQPGARLGAREGHKAHREEEGVNDIHSRHAEAKAEGDLICHPVRELRLREGIAIGLALHQEEVAEVVKPVAPHLEAQADEEREGEGCKNPDARQGAAHCPIWVAAQHRMRREGREGGQEKHEPVGRHVAHTHAAASRLSLSIALTPAKFSGLGNTGGSCVQYGPVALEHKPGRPS